MNIEFGEGEEERPYESPLHFRDGDREQNHSWHPSQTIMTEGQRPSWGFWTLCTESKLPAGLLCCSSIT